MAALWERQPEEPPRAFNAFTIYRDLPPTSRTIAKTAEIIGHKGASGCLNWSSRYQWVERAAAFDEYKSNQMLVLQQLSMEEYRKAIVGQETQALAGLFQIIQNRIKQINDYQADGGLVKSIELYNTAKALEAAANMARRAVGLPVNYISEEVAQPDYENTVYYVGGQNDED